MGNPADDIYPNGPSNRLGNDRPKVDITNMNEQQKEQYEKDEREFRLGEDEDKEAFAKKYGIKHAIDQLDKAIMDMEGPNRKATGHGSDGLFEELKQWRNRFDERLNGSKAPTA